MDLQGKVAVITGSGSGIGQSLAVGLAREGTKIVCCGRRESMLRKTVSLVEAEDGQALAIPTDVTKKDQIGEVISRVLSEFGGIDILINNAGSFAAPDTLWECDPDMWWHDVEVNLRGTMLCCHAVLPHMMGKDAGIIINLSGGGAASPMTAGSGYGSSKAAVLRLTDTLARELKHENSSVLVFAVDPGFNRTAMTENLATSPAASKWWSHIPARLGEDDETMRQKYVRIVADLIRMATPELSGRVFSAGVDMEQIAARAEEISEADLFVLRLR
ncbi:SDR family NAD(P)-dependent oxidoreductase [Candidatus Poribacteria bacterium]